MASREKEAEWLLQADFCRKMADTSSTVEKKVAWLNLASKWLALASNVRVVGDDTPFDSVVLDAATRQKAPVSSR